MVSPWDYRTLVPSFENESENFVEVVLVQRGDRAALESGTVLAAATAQINRANAPKAADKRAEQEDPKASLATVAKRYGLAPDEVDRAIRAWGAKTTDSYEAGLAALYERNYSKASSQLADALQKREERLVEDQKAVAEAACFLVQSLYEEGRYHDSAARGQRCLQLRPTDSAVLNNVALSCLEAGDYAAAEPLFQRALAIDEKFPDRPAAAIDLYNIAVLQHDKGNYAAAELLDRRALAISEKVFGAQHPLVAMGWNNIGGVLEAEGDYAAAEVLYGRALAIDEKTLAGC